MTTADIPKVRILDPKGRVVREGYYFEYPAYMGPGICDGDTKPIPTKRCVMTYDQGDWSMPNTPRFLEVTSPHTIEVIDPAAPSASADASGMAAMRCNMAAMRHAIETAIGDLQSSLEMTPDERQFMARYLKAAIDKPARNCDKFQGDYKMLYTAWFDWTGSPSGQNPDGTVKMSFPEYLLAPATTKGGAV